MSIDSFLDSNDHNTPQKPKARAQAIGLGSAWALGSSGSGSGFLKPELPKARHKLQLSGRAKPAHH
ncbi:hypothetical protein CVT25_013265 [Psilocybe cyanescens]|uniref:Uncharacterized protein n=1 Tax=Psilocybe cyanescens TaxID=93625 RepID=A0A409XK48_PSICY|nr:hypothetical protein CVT25_013265 [Psilocybe cyanescens]